MSDYRKGYVYIQDIFAGIISETDTGYTFQYNDEYIHSKEALSLSLTMPISQTKFTSNVLFPFFDGLIPEGWLLNLACKNWKLNSKDRFGLLLVTCNDCIGDVSIHKTLD